MKLRDALADQALMLAPWAPEPARLALARRAARRGLAAAALKAAPTDPDVLVDTGLYRSAAQSDDPVARMIGLAGLGCVDKAAALHGEHAALDGRRRLQLARAAAPFSPAFALQLLPESAYPERAACLLALGRIEAAEAELDRTSPSRERWALHAAARAALGDHRAARGALNSLFAADALEAPFAPGDRPASIQQAEAEAPALHGEGPRVSIVMAARNAAATIVTALRSLTRQTWRNLEIVVVDDGSTDDTAALVRRCAERDSRIVLHGNTWERGAYGARNTGVAVATGDLVVFHDADDWAHPRRVERQVEAMGGRAASICRYLRLTDEGRIVNPRIFPLLRINPILCAVRKSVLDRLGPFDPVQLGGDSELLARLEARFGRWNVERIPACLVLARWDKGSLMAAKATGLSAEGARLRVNYAEAWRRRHAETFRLPRLPLAFGRL